ncbi:MAG: extracellular solute-binding protein, partial [Candidatus Sumerlaeia bacterium]|nr:extracellular solute-binding protein [Candidatus Sumerlaeia bacterium]
MHLKRMKIIASLFLILITVVFFSCKKQDSESTRTLDNSSAVAVKEKTYTIVVNGGVPEDDKERLAEQELFQRLFHQRFPNIKLEFSTWQFSPESFIAKISAGTATDIIGVFATEGTVVIEKHLAADITDLVKNWELYPYINREVIAPFTHEGKIYGVPAGGIGGGYVMTLFYNKEMFEAYGITPPATWSELL